MSTRRRVALGVALFFISVVALTLVTFGPARDRDISNLGVDVFDIGNTSRIAGTIAENGPILIPDPLDRGRPLWIQHQGQQVDTGWSVFSAVVGDECTVEYRIDSADFLDCNGVVYPADGDGLQQYPVTVDGSVVSVDVNFLEREPPGEDGTESTETDGGGG